MITIKDILKNPDIDLGPLPSVGETKDVKTLEITKN